jgi:hypothetical protein
VALALGWACRSSATAAARREPIIMSKIVIEIEPLPNPTIRNRKDKMQTIAINCKL